MSQSTQTLTQVPSGKTLRFTAEEEAQLQQQAMVLVGQVDTNLSAPEMARQFESLGKEEQEKLFRQSQLLGKKVVDFQVLKGGEGQIASSLVKFRDTMDQLNPHRHKITGVGKLLSAIPIIGPMILKAWDKSTLSQIANNHQSLNQQVEAAVTSLEANKDVILTDNIELERIYGNVERTQFELRRKIFIGDVLVRKLDEMSANADETTALKIATVKSRVLRRVQNLQVMVESNAQALVSANISIENNVSLSETIDEMIQLGIPQLNTALMILSALASQRQAADAVRATQDYIGNVMVQNAEMLKRNTEDIAKLRNNPILAMDKVRQSHQLMMELVNKLEEMRETGDKVAIQNIAELSRMSDQLQEQADTLKGSRQLSETINAQEGSKQLPEGNVQ